MPESTGDPAAEPGACYLVASGGCVVGVQGIHRCLCGCSECSGAPSSPTRAAPLDGGWAGDLGPCHCGCTACGSPYCAEAHVTASRGHRRVGVVWESRLVEGLVLRTASQLVSTPEAAAILGVSRSQVVRLIHRKALPAHWWNGRTWALEEAEVRGYAATRVAGG